MGSGSSDALSSLPVNVVVAAGGAALSGVSSLSTSAAYHICAMMSTGGVKCWGANFYGELGDGAGGSDLFSNVPVNVIGLTSFSISGRVTLNGNALSGVTISAGAGRTTSSDSSGNYSLTGLAAGSYTLTPTKTSYIFTPTLLGVTITSADVSGKNFTAKVGFNSQFNGNMLNWGAVRGVWTVNSINLLSPILSVTGSASTAYRAANYSKLDYSVRLMRTGCTTCFTSLFIRGSGVALSAGGWSNSYQFSITRDGRYYVAKTLGSTPIVLKPLTFSTSILKLNSWNVLRVVASGTIIRFYVNNKLLWYGSDRSFVSGKVGLGLVNNGTGGANRLSVDYATLSVP